MKIRGNKGFSFVELVIVIAIIAIVVAIAVPNFMAYRDNADLREAVQDVVSDIQLSKERAVSESVQYTITFNDPGANQYTIRGGAVNQVKTVGANSAMIIITGVPSFFPAGTPTLTLDTRGTMGNGIVRLKHTRRAPIARITTTTTGRVQVAYE